jgi:hypothetical protein
VNEKAGGKCYKCEISGTSVRRSALREVERGWTGQRQERDVNQARATMLPTSMARTESETEAATMSPLLVVFELLEPEAVALGPDEPACEPDFAPDDEPAEVDVGTDVDCRRPEMDS